MIKLKQFISAHTFPAQYYIAYTTLGIVVIILIELYLVLVYIQNSMQEDNNVHGSKFTYTYSMLPSFYHILTQHHYVLIILSTVLHNDINYVQIYCSVNDYILTTWPKHPCISL